MVGYDLVTVQAVSSVIDPRVSEQTVGGSGGIHRHRDFVLGISRDSSRLLYRRSRSPTGLRLRR